MNVQLYNYQENINPKRKLAHPAIIKFQGFITPAAKFLSLCSLTFSLSFETSDYNYCV